MALCSSQYYDLVIVGAGMVGASLACILDKSGQDRPMSILLVESTVIDLDAPAAQPSFDARSTVLSHGTVDYLRELGLWTELKCDAEAIKKIHVSDQGKFGAVRMDNVELGVDALGYVMENRLLGKMFNKSLAAIGSLEICSGVGVSNIKPEPSGMKVTLDDGSQQCILTTALVVMAEGGRSGLCEKLGIHRSRESYQQEAVIANVAFTSPHKNVAYERFTPHGPLALLPLPDHDSQHRAALVWTRNTDEVSKTLALSDNDFLQQLNEEFGSRLGRFTRVGQRSSYPLSLIQAQEQVRPGLVLLGNVAHSLHPVAGQGFNLAFRDTAHLAAILLEAVSKGAALGDVALLHRYQNETGSDQHMTAMFSHYMTRLFSSNNIAAVWVRKFGLFSIDLVMPVRKAFARRAMGMGEAKVTLNADA